jgi:DNA end-binding protein Ku
MAAPRPQWKGALKINLVQVPVRLYSAAETKDKISFHKYHVACGNRMQNKSWCPHCSQELAAEMIERGYEHTKGAHLTVSDEELDTIAEQSSGALDITTITHDAINPVYIDGTAYLVPEDGAQRAFETVRRALGDRTAIGSMVLRNRAQQVALEATTDGFIVYKLRAAEQVRTFADVQPTPLKVEPPLSDIALATQLLDNLEGEFSYEGVHDLYTERLKEMLEAKAEGKVIPVAVAPMVASFSLTEALTASLKLQQLKTDKLPAKATGVAKVTTPAKKGKKTA